MPGVRLEKCYAQCLTRTEMSLEENVLQVQALSRGEIWEQVLLRAIVRSTFFHLAGKVVVLRVVVLRSRRGRRVSR